MNLCLDKNMSLYAISEIILLGKMENEKPRSCREGVINQHKRIMPQFYSSEK